MTSFEIVNEALAASRERRSISTSTLVSAASRLKEGTAKADLCWLIVDQIFYFDSNNHDPVLLTFVRIKNASDFTADS